MSDSGRITPTAHYTGYVWARNGLSDPALETIEGRLLYESLRVPMAISGALGGGTLEAYLLARHRAIDARLERAIEDGRVHQVIEVACGLSPRGLRFTERYGDRIRYLEADLPGMAARKRRALERIGSLSDAHRVEEVDALREDGPGSLTALAGGLDRGEGLAIVTEGLLGYLERHQVEALWRRSARTLKRFERGTYISDILIGELQPIQVRTFLLVLGAFVRGRVHLHFGDEAEIVATLREAGFSRAEVLRASMASQGRAGPTGGPSRDPAGQLARSDPAGQLAHILEASTA